MADKELQNEKRSGSRIFFDEAPENVNKIEIYRSEFKDGTYRKVASLNRLDANGRPITSYVDSLASVSDWYVVRFIKLDGTSTDSDKVRVVRITPIKLYFQEPSLEDRDIVEIVIKRSIDSTDEADGLDGTYDIIEKFRARDSFGNFKSVWSDMGGSTEFYYRVQYVVHRWDISLGKSVARVSEDSDPVKGEDLTKSAAKLSLNLTVSDWSLLDAITREEYKQCGYHRISPEEYFCKGQSSPYSRSWGGDCGMDASQRNHERQLLMLESTGRPVKLYRRKWTGDRCKCADRIREHQINRCPICFSTQYVGGYDEYVSDYREDGLLLVRFSPTQERVDITDNTGLAQNYHPSGWTLSSPRMRPRDFIIAYDPVALADGELRETWRYVVSGVNQNDLFCAMPGKQNMQMDRLDRTDVIYWVDNVDIGNSDQYYSDDSSMRNLRGDAPNLPRRGRS